MFQSINTFKICYDLHVLLSFSECTQDIHCGETHKNTCNTGTNECVCNAGFTLIQENCECIAGEVDNGNCNPCQNNEFVNGQGRCEKCPPGEEPMVDRQSCMNCPPGQISPDGICMACTDPAQVPNTAMTTCVGKLDLMIWKVAVLP